jgi:hypothetical protein
VLRRKILPQQGQEPVESKRDVSGVASVPGTSCRSNAKLEKEYHPSVQYGAIGGSRLAQESMEFISSVLVLVLVVWIND